MRSASARSGTIGRNGTTSHAVKSAHDSVESGYDSVER